MQSRNFWPLDTQPSYIYLAFDAFKDFGTWNDEKTIEEHGKIVGFCFDF